MRVLVTGGTGFLGRAVVARLAARGDSVRVFARGHRATDLPAGVELHRGDIGDLQGIANAVRGCDLVIHTAALAALAGPRADFVRANIDGTRHVIEACRRHGVPRLVHTSTPSVVFDGSDMEGADESVPIARRFDACYPETKAKAERLVLAANGPEFATTALRPHIVWGPGDHHVVPRILALARAGTLRLVGDGRKKVDSTYIDNAADAHLLAADSLAPGAPCAGRAYFISNGEPLPVGDLLNRILAAGGLPPVTRSASPAFALMAGWVLETAHSVFGRSGEPRMTRFLARELSTAHWFDLSAARRDLGYAPRVSIDAGMARLAAWLKSESGR